jgi:hypothetical protein
MTKGASAAVFTFTRYEERLVERIDRDSAKRQEFVIMTTKALKLTSCSLITRGRKQKRKKRLMN